MIRMSRRTRTTNLTQLSDKDEISEMILKLTRNYNYPIASAKPEPCTGDKKRCDPHKGETKLAGA